MNNYSIRLFVRRELRAVTFGVATAIGLGGGLPAAIAGPAGGAVVSGQGTISRPNAATTLINQQSNQLTLNWSSFDVAGNEAVRFVQPSSTSVALNNILDHSASQIFGKIDANGRVVLVNPNGILFGRTAQLNVGSLIASSLELTGFDPTTGRFSFQSLSGHPGAIDNEGTITAAHGGSIALLGGTVLNNGLVVADYGTVAMGAGKVATLDFYGGGLLRLQVNGDLDSNPSGAGAAVQNAGRIEADGGQVVLTARATQDVFASAVNNSGVIRASRIENVGGVIELSGPEGVVSNSGTLDASGIGAASTGGTVQVTGQDVGLFGNAAVNVSGSAGGGTALIGGGFHGVDPSVQDASRTYVAPGATIAADALSNGDGGKVAVWSSDGTQFYGEISARGSGSGAGGFTEVSGKTSLDFNGLVNLRAPSGMIGTLLLDPTEITIEHGASSNDKNVTASTTGPGPFTDTQTSAPPPSSILTDSTINTQLGLGNVTVTTSSGDILISGAGVALGGGAASTTTLTLNSAAGISWDSAWTYTSQGQLTLNATGSLASGISISSGGTLTLGSTSPLLMGGATGIGTSTTPIATSGLSSVAAATTTGGIFVSNSTTGSVSLALTTNPVGGGPVDGLSSTTSGDISLDTAGPISQVAGSAAAINTSGTLTTSSVGGTTLESNSNSVAAFNATNTGGGGVAFVDSRTGQLAVTGISQPAADTGTVQVVTHGGAISITGAIAAGAGNVTLDPSSAVSESGVGLISTTGTVTINSAGGVTLSGAGANAFSGLHLTNLSSGDVSIANTVPLSISSIAQNALGAYSVTVHNTGALSTTGVVSTNGPGAANIALQSTGLLTLGTAVTAGGTGSVSLTGAGVTVGTGPGTTPVTGPGGVTVNAGTGTLTNTSGTLTNGGDASPIALTADAMSLAGGTGTIAAGSGAVSLTSSTANRPIAIGGGVTGSALDLSSSALNTITTTGALTIGDTAHTGTISTDGAVAGVANPSGPWSLLTDGGTITLNDAVTAPGNLTLNTTGASGVTVGAATGGTITEAGGGLIHTTGTLTTVSSGGTALGGANTVSVFDASNKTADPVTLTNAAPLTITGIADAGGSVTVTNNAGTTLGGAVNAAGGSVTLKDTGGSLALGTSNVTGGGVTLQGATVTQSAGSTVDAGAGDILVNGGGGLITMAGALTTTSSTATAATVRNASNVALPSITTGSSGTTTLGVGADISGNVSQSGATVISTGTLAGGSSAGTIDLPNHNLVATLGAVTGASVQLNDFRALSIAGTVNGGAGGVRLTSTGTISEGGGLVSTTGTLTTVSTGGTNLSGANIVSAFHATDTGGTLILSNAAAPLGITGISESGGSISVSNSGATTVTGAVTTGTSGTGIALQSTGLLTIDAPVAAAGSGSVSLIGGGVTNASTVTGPGGVAVNAGTGTLDNSAAGALTNGGDGASVTLQADTMSLASGTVTGGSGAVSLTASTSGRAIAIGGGTTAGVLDLSSAALNSITTTGALTIGSTSDTGTISTDGAVTGVTHPSGPWSLLTDGGAITLNDAVATPGDLTLNTTGPLGTVASGAVNGSGTLTIGTGGAGNLGVVAGAGINLSNAGNEATGVSLTNDAPSATGNIHYDNAHDMTLVASNAAAGGTLTVVNTVGALSTSGVVTTSGGAADITLQTAGTMTIANDVTAGGSGSVTLTTSGPNDLLVQGAVSAASGGAITASSGHAITESGGGKFGTTGLLTTSSAAEQTLAGANTVSSFSGTNTGSGAITLTNLAGTLIVAGISEGGGGAVAVNNSGAMALTGAIAAGSGSVGLTSTGAISESGGGLVSTSGTLTTASVGGAMLGGANAVSGFSAVNTGSGDVTLVNTASPLTLAAIAQSGGGAVSVSNSGALTLTGAVAAGSGSVGLTSTGAISESGGGLISTTGALTTVSAGGTTLGGANAVGAFNATNTTSGDLRLVNTAAAPLTVTGITQSGGGSVAVSNGGALTLADAVAADGGNVALTSTGTISESGSGTVGTTGRLTTTSVGGTTLGGANAISTLELTNSGSGDVQVENTGALAVSGANSGGGAFDVTAGGALTAGAINAGGGPVNLRGTQVALDGAVGGGSIATTATSGDIGFGAAGVLDSTGAVTLAANSGAVLGNNATTTNVTGASLTATAANGIGSNNVLSTAVGTLSATNSTGGAVNVRNSGALGVSGSNSGGGAFGITATGALTAGAINANGGPVTLQGSSVGLNETVDGSAIAATATGGDIHFGAAGAIDATGAVTLAANGGAILGNDGATTNVTGASLTATASAGIGTTASPLFTHVATLSAVDSGTSGGIDIVNDPTGTGSSVTTVDALQLTNPANSGGDVTFVASTGSVVVPDPSTAALQAQGGTIRLTADAGSLSVSSAATTGNGSVELIAKGASSDLNVGSISAGGHVLLVAGSSILGIGPQATVTADAVEARFGIQNASAQLSSADAAQQLGLVSATGSQVALKVWAPQGTQSATGHVKQTASSFEITQVGFPANDLRLEPALYEAPFGATAGDVEALANEALGLSTATSFQLAPEARLAASDSSGAGHNVLYVDWASYNPNVSLFGTLNPPVCLPGDQREEDASSASGCAAPPSQAWLTPIPGPTRTAMVLTRLGWLTVPSFDPTR